MEERVLPGRRVLLRPAPSFRGGSGLACAAIPPAPPSDVFQNRGIRCYLRRGLRPLHPAWGVVARLHTVMLATIAPPWHCREIIPRLRCMRCNRKVSFFSRGFGLACAAIPPAPPSDVFRNRGTPPVTPGGGCAPCTPPGRMERRRFLHLPRQLLAEVPEPLGYGDVLGFRR